MKQDGLALSYVRHDLKKNIDIVLEAVNNDVRALKLVNELDLYTATAAYYLNKASLNFLPKNIKTQVYINVVCNYFYAALISVPLLALSPVLLILSKIISLINSKPNLSNNNYNWILIDRSSSANIVRFFVPKNIYDPPKIHKSLGVRS